MSNRRPEDAVLAMLAPSLGDHFELHVGGFALPAAKDLLHGKHVLTRKRKFHELTQFEESVTVQIRDLENTVMVRRRFGDPVENRKSRRIRHWLGSHSTDESLRCKYRAQNGLTHPLSRRKDKFADES